MRLGLSLRQWGIEGKCGFGIFSDIFFYALGGMPVGLIPENCCCFEKPVSRFRHQRFQDVFIEGPSAWLSRPAKSHKSDSVTDCVQLHTRKNMDSRMRRSIGCPCTKPAPFDAVSAACDVRVTNLFARCRSRFRS